MVERVVVLGGTGFIGRALVSALGGTGSAVRVGSRNPPAVPIQDVEHVRCDLESGAGLDDALKGGETVYFLVHGMAAGREFAERERAAAINFIAAARRQGVDRVIYLGGLYPEGDLSPHLASRREVGLRLIEGTGALVIRAGIVVGAGGASFDILFGLCQRLPLMLAPRWLASLCQPISLGDTVDCLVGAAGLPGGRELDLAGPDVLAYRAMLEITAIELRGRRPLMFPVPLLSPELSAHWLRLVAKVNMNVARSLVSSLRHDLVAERPLISAELELNPMSFRESVRQALTESNRRIA